MPEVPSAVREHAPTAIVALSTLGVALADGAYAPGVYAGVTLGIWIAVMAVALWTTARLEVTRPAIVCGGALAGVALLSAFSIAWAEDYGRAGAEAVRAAGYVGLLALVVLTSRGGSRHWLHGLAIGLAAVAVVALASRLEPSLPGGDDEIATALPAALGRVSYPIGYWNALAAAMALGIVLLSWLGAAATTRAARALAVAGLPLCALVIYFASSRGALAAALLGLVVLFVALPDRPRLLGGVAIGGVGAGLLVWLASRRSELVDGVPGDTAASQGDEMLIAAIIICAAAGAARWALDEFLEGVKERIKETFEERIELPRLEPWTIAAIGAVAVLVVAIVADLPGRLDEFNDPPPEGPAAEVSGELTRGGGSGRYQFWSAALDAFEEDTAIGVGAGSYEFWWNQNGSLAGSVRDAHSILFELPAELGLLGLALLIAFVGAPAASGIARLRGAEDSRDRSVIAAALALFTAGMVAASIDWIWEFPAVFGAVVVAAALLTGPGTSRPSEPAVRRGWGIAALAFGGVAICASALLALSEIKLDASRDAVSDGDLPAAGQDARDAATLQPWAAEPRLQLALVEELSNDLPAARDELEEAIERAPGDWRLELVAIRLETQDGRLDEARRALERARDLSPRQPLLEAPGTAGIAGQ